MLNFGNINSAINPVKVAISLLLAGGVAVLAYVFARYGLVMGAAFAILPAALIALWFSLKNPAWSMLGLFVINYFIMGVGREVRDFPVGTILDALIMFNVLMVSLHALVRPIEWSKAKTGITLIAIIWLLFGLLQGFNPYGSTDAWLSAIRSFGFYFLLLVVLTQLTMAEYKYLRYIIIIWAILTLCAVAKACFQKFVGFTVSEKYWLFVLGARRTHIIYSGIRYFSFFSDAANFGAGMGFSMVVLSISGLFFKERWLKFLLFFSAAAACYAMLISGTRSALAIPFFGFSLFVVLSRNTRMTIMGAIAILTAFVILNFTQIGESNSIIRRARSAFNTEDASFQVRLENQAKLRELMKGKYLGVGLGMGGGKALRYQPESKIAQIPTDSWYVMMWVETGIVGLLLHICILLYIIGYGSFQVIFRLKNVQLKGLIAALVSGLAGVCVMAYANEVLGQIPTGAMVYISMAFIFLAPRLDKELTDAEDPALKTTA